MAWTAPRPGRSIPIQASTLALSGRASLRAIGGDFQSHRAERLKNSPVHILCVLAGNTLFALKTEGDDITTPKRSPWRRMRDMISSPMGASPYHRFRRADLIRNGAKHEGAPSSFVVSGLSNRPQL